MRKVKGESLASVDLYDQMESADVFKVRHFPGFLCRFNLITQLL